MHPNPIFRRATDAVNQDFVRERGFGTLAINAEPAPLLAHVPFVPAADFSFLDLHLVRSNPILRHLKDDRPAVISVVGADSYVSPDWYGLDNQVPTWNYVSVHLRGQLAQLPTSRLDDILNRLSHQFEQKLAPKPAWTSDKMDVAIKQKMMRMIVPLRLQIEDIQGTWKLGQNKPAIARDAAATSVADAGLGLETKALAALMQGLAND